MSSTTATNEENGKPLERSEDEEAKIALEAAKAAAASITSEKERLANELKDDAKKQQEAEKDMSTSDLKALKQLEFYFSDSNFRFCIEYERKIFLFRYKNGYLGYFRRFEQFN